MKLKCLTLLKDKKLSSQLTMYIKEKPVLELVSNDEQSFNKSLKTQWPVDVVFFEIPDDCGYDLEEVLSQSYMYRSLVLIVNRINCNLESHLLSDIEYLFAPFIFMELDLLIRRIQKKYGEAILNYLLNQNISFSKTLKTCLK